MSVKLLPFKGLSCTASQHSLYIIGNRIATCGSEGLTTENFRWRDERQVCPYTYCGNISCVPICVGEEDGGNPHTK